MTDLSANHDAQIISVAVVFETLMVLSLIARIVSIRLRHNRFGLDDLLLAVAFVRLLNEEQDDQALLNIEQIAASSENIWYAICKYNFSGLD